MGAGTPDDAARIVVETAQLPCSENGYEREGLLLTHCLSVARPGLHPGPPRDRVVEIVRAGRVIEPAAK